MFFKRFKFRPFLVRFQKDENGQALAELALTILVFLMIILGIIQLSMVMNAKSLTNYAAYCAARAGIVHNGNMTRMRQAAAVALTPLFTKSSSFGGLALGYGRAFMHASVGAFLNVSIVSPGGGRFSSGNRDRFFPTLRPTMGSLRQLNNNVLVVRVTYWYPLEIPFINKIMSPFLKRVRIVSTCQMRMQSDNEVR